MKLIAAILILISACSSVFAVNTFCNANAPYHIEKIPHGYAIVRINWADYCKKPWLEEEKELPYVCDGKDDYRMNFRLEKDLLIMVQEDGDTTFTRCE